VAILMDVWPKTVYLSMLYEVSTKIIIKTSQRTWTMDKPIYLA